MIIKVKLGQSILGFTFAFIMLAAMAIGLTRIWAWYNINFGSRQVRYQESRISATLPGGAGNAYLIQQIDKNAYRPLDLTEQWVFKGKPTETTPYTMPDFGSLRDAAAECRNQCDGNPAGEPDCVDCVIDPDTGENICSVDVNCPCYVRCMCLERIQSQLAMYQEQMDALWNAAQQMYAEARDLRNEAARCDDPWEICWWGGFGLPSKKLKEAARSLEQEARKLLIQRAAILALKNSLAACCDEPTVVDQAICIEHINTSMCPAIKNGYTSDWQDNINESQSQINFARAIQAAIDNNYGRPAPDDNGCMRWADYHCQYIECEQNPGIWDNCIAEIENNCFTECSNTCAVGCPTRPPDPPGVEPVCYNNCLNRNCIEDLVRGPSNWYERCVFDREHLDPSDPRADPNYPVSFLFCLDRDVAACYASCILPGDPRWEAAYNACCRTFCCDEAALGNCSFGIFDRRFHGYERMCSWSRFAGWRNRDCCMVEQAGEEYGLWIYPGKLGDGCIITWRARYPEWSGCAYNGLFCFRRDYESWCIGGATPWERWWERPCVAPDTDCDTDCENTGAPGWTMPPGCILDPGCPACVPPIPPTIAKCGLDEYQERLDDVIADYQADILKYQAKQNFIQGCCTYVADGGRIDWVLSAVNPPLGTCKVLDPDGLWQTSPDEVTEFECMSVCIEMASALGEEGVPEEQTLEEQCPACFPVPPLDPAPFEQCIRECTGTTTDCCVYWCTRNTVPEKYSVCIDACMSRCPLCVDMDCATAGSACVAGCVGPF